MVVIGKPVNREVRNPFGIFTDDDPTSDLHYVSFGSIPADEYICNSCNGLITEDNAFPEDAPISEDDRKNKVMGVFLSKRDKYPYDTYHPDCARRLWKDIQFQWE